MTATQQHAQAHWAATGGQPRIAVIGAGVSGIAAVVKLRKAGYTDVTVFEKSSRVGGTWRENTYPGLSCDVPSRWYSFSFALNPDWPHRYSYGPDIQAYIEKVAQDFDVIRAIRFNTPVTRLRYAAPHWQLLAGETDSAHEHQEETFDIVISATGILHKITLPDIPGRERFAGQSFHSARWDHSVSLHGKRVGVIGTGSTACQIVGAVTPDVGEMVVFQRTPQWMSPLPQKQYSKGWKWLMNALPFMPLLTYHYYYQFLVRTFSAATVGNKTMQRLLAWVCRKNLEDNVADPVLREQLTPDYDATCKRLIFCSDFYPAISSDNARLVTDEIASIEPDGVRTGDGKLHTLDVLVYATGFDAAAFILPTQVIGENGADLEEQWDGSPRAHRAVSVPGFPNFWMLEGPTGPIGNLSLIAISEHQVDYVISMLDRMRSDHLQAITPRQSAYETYNAAMAEAIQDTTWVTGGCTSWYFDKSGKPNLYPWFPVRYLKDMHNPDFEEYELIK